MKKIVIIGAGEFQLPLIFKAREMGFETHVFAWARGAVGKNAADFFYPISIIEKEEILTQCKIIRPEAVVSVGSDLAVLTVNYISRALGLPCNPLETDLCATNKFMMRQTFREYGMKTPAFIKVNEYFSEIDLKDLQFPLIVKPTDRSGSRGICKVNTYNEACIAVKNACKESFESCAIIEEEIKGEEYSCECITQNEVHHILSFTKKYTTNEPAYIETAHLEPADISKSQEDIVKKEIIKGLNALHIVNGASHAEFRLSDTGEVQIIEIGARMGGDCIGTHLVPLSSGYDFTKMVIDTACGNPIDLSCWNEKKVSYIRFIMDKRDIQLLENIRMFNPEYIRYIKEIETTECKKVVDSSTRHGFFILQCDTFAELNSMIEKNNSST